MGDVVLCCGSEMNVAAAPGMVWISSFGAGARRRVRGRLRAETLEMESITVSAESIKARVGNKEAEFGGGKRRWNKRE